MADRVKINVKEMIAFSKKIGDIRTLERIYTNAFEDLLDGLQSLSKKFHDFESRTGALEGAIFTEIKGKKGSVFVPTSVVKYAGAVYEGYGSFRIEAKNKKVLSDGNSFFGKSVLHPGYKGDPFILNNWLKYADKLTREFLDTFVKQYKIALRSV